VDKIQREALAQQVVAHPKYRTITTDLVLRLSQEALNLGLTGKPAVKYVRNKLHQVGSAYFKQKIDFTATKGALAQLPQDSCSDDVKNFCRKLMQKHTSTAERLPILTDFYQTCLASIAPITSIIDLACGLNPLAVPWMPLADEVQYFACDIYCDMLDMIDAFFRHISLGGQADPCDLVSKIPSTKTQLAFLLKSIPCLEQLDKSIARHLLENIPSDHILVSFPVHSLGGRHKGMKSFYRDHFNDLIAGNAWHVQEFNFATELAFLVSK
jgi:16S rRNA (guanine(1405)-N(7))-methyltransferase